MRLGATVVALEVAAIGLALLAFGWVVVVVGAPLLLGTVVVLVGIRLAQEPLRRLRERRADRHHEPGPSSQGGLMSGFFEVPTAGA